MSNIVCVAADSPKERGYILRTARGKTEAIPRIEKRAGLKVNSLACEKEPRSEISSFPIKSPRVNRFWVK